MNNQFAVIIVAAGKGTRMQSTVSKQYLLIEDKPILVHTLKQFERIEEVGEIVVVVGKDDLAMVSAYVERYRLAKIKAVVAGGSERQYSVRCGLDAVSSQFDWVMIHDGVRPLITENRVRALWQEVQQCEAAVLAVPVKDTVKIVDANQLIQSTPDRSTVWAIQTPQAFRKALLEKAHNQAELDGYTGTDDAMLVERLGCPVKVVEGDYSNIKITTPEDLVWAQTLLKEREL